MKLATAVLVSLVLVPCAAGGQEAPEVPFSMPVPDGWREETIPFPLTFAPELDYEGLEELRFAPGMFEEGSDDFWSYAFVWWLPADTELYPKALTADLEAYFRGLAKAVSEQRGFDLGDAVFQATLREEPSSGRGERILRGEVTTFDAFTTRASVRLNVRLSIWQCAAQKRRVAFFELSPQPATHEVWQTLSAIRQGFRCEK